MVPLRLSLLAAMGLLGCGDKDDTSTESGTETGETGTSALCLDPTDILDAEGRNTGFVRCADGAVNRVVAAEADPVIDQRQVWIDPFGTKSAEIGIPFA